MEVKFTDIIKAIGLAFKVSPTMLLSQSVKDEFSHPRMLAYFIAKHYCNYKIKDISLYFDRSHNAIISGIKSCGTLIEYEQEYRFNYAEALTLLNIKMKNCNGELD